MRLCDACDECRSRLPSTDLSVNLFFFFSKREMVSKDKGERGELISETRYQVA